MEDRSGDIETLFEFREIFMLNHVDAAIVFGIFLKAAVNLICLKFVRILSIFNLSI